ncbi:MAG: amidase, partial [Cyanobacteria bacterium P01_H01_bin.130]
MMVPIAIPMAVFGGSAIARAAQPVTLDVGVVQRFGEEATDTVTVKAVKGDRLTVRFQDPQAPGQTRNLITDALQLTVRSQPLPEPELREIVVLGTFRSFETAEEAANRWRDRGIQVEIAQPSNRWQVWGDRRTYSDP